MNYEITGELIKLGEIQSFGDKGFQKREVVVKTSGEYPQFIPIEVSGNKIDIADPFKVGDVVTVGFNLNGRPWEKDGVTKYFPSISAWKITHAESGQPAQTPGKTPQGTAKAAFMDDDDSDELGF